MNHSPDDEFGVNAKVHLIHAETEKAAASLQFSPISLLPDFEAVIHLHREVFSGPEPTDRVGIICPK